jgi:Uma2 family endonuclease
MGRTPALSQFGSGAQNQGVASRMSSMNATAATSETSQRLSRAELRERWQQLADNRLVAEIPCKVELSEKGAIEVSPPTIRHAFIQGFLTRELARQRPDGTTLPECTVETDIGMRVPDLVWVSRELMERHRGEKQFRVAPDLCVEVLSPTNTRIQMVVWIVDENGVPEIHTSDGRVSASTLGFELPPLPAD